MIRAYRFLVTVYIEADDTNDLPGIEEAAEVLATLVSEGDLSVCVRAAEIEDYDRTSDPRTEGVDG